MVPTSRNKTVLRNTQKTATNNINTHFLICWDQANDCRAPIILIWPLKHDTSIMRVHKLLSLLTNIDYQEHGKHIIYVAEIQFTTSDSKLSSHSSQTANYPLNDSTLTMRIHDPVPRNQHGLNVWNDSVRVNSRTLSLISHSSHSKHLNSLLEVRLQSAIPPQKTCWVDLPGNRFRFSEMTVIISDTTFTNHIQSTSNVPIKPNLLTELTEQLNKQ